MIFKSIYSSSYNREKNQHEYKFSCYNHFFFHIICDESFSRGDFLEISYIDEINARIIVRKSKEESKDVLFFLLSTIPLNNEINYNFITKDQEDKIIYNKEIILYRNLTYFLILVSSKEKTKIIGKNSQNNDIIEFIIDKKL